MADKFVKAYCPKSRKYYGMKVEEVSSKLKVTDFYDIGEETAKLLASNVDVLGLETAANLRSCPFCHSRKVAGCGCLESRASCKPDQGYRYLCIYCKELRVFASSEGAEVSGRVGRKVVLTQGQEVMISVAGSGSLEHIRVGVGWDISQSERNMDLDASVLVKDSSNGEGELIYFGNKTHSSGCVVHMGDNITGGKFEGNKDATDSENIDVYLRKVPAACDRLYFILNIYDCIGRSQAFKDVQNMYIRLTNGKTGQVLVEYTASNISSRDTGIIIGVASRRGGSWVFRASGQTYRVATIQELCEYCTK